jgi:4-amino-4-deoxy-L-arabinose transferase-like glycosyltransferase
MALALGVALSLVASATAAQMKSLRVQVRTGGVLRCMLVWAVQSTRWISHTDPCFRQEVDEKYEDQHTGPGWEGNVYKNPAMIEYEQEMAANPGRKRELC